MTRSLLERVVDFVVANPGMTLPEIARGVRARDIEIRTILSSETFSASVRDQDEYRSPQVYRLAPGGADGLGRRQRKSQNDVLEVFLRAHQGERHTTRQIHDACGSSRLNSRIPELKKRRGMDIDCIRIPGTPPGPDGQEYIFHGYLEGFGPSEAADTSARSAAAPGGESAASDGPDAQHGSPVADLLTDDAGPSDEQLDLGEAA